MRHRLIFLTWLTLAAMTIYAQETKKCDLSFFQGKQLVQLTENDIKLFLLTFDTTCRNNVEYSEGSNELLFALLDKQTELTLLTIKKYEESILLGLILDELTNPVNDSFDLRAIIKKVKKAQTNKRLKRKILGKLKIAESKMT